MCADKVFLDTSPSQDNASYVPVHGYLLAEQGSSTLEVEFPENFSHHGVSEFALIGGSLKLRGANAAPIRPVATPLRYYQQTGGAGDMPYAVDHIVLNVKDMDAMLTFYTDVLKLAAERLEEYRRGEVSFPSVRVNSESIIDLFPAQENDDSSAGQRNLHHFCLAMRKQVWNELQQRLEQSGIEIKAGPEPRWGARGRGRSICFDDPDGNEIEVRYYESRG